MEERENLFVWRLNACDDVSVGHSETYEVEEIALSSKLSTWHRRLGHNNWKDLSKLWEHVDGMSVSVDDFGLCECREMNKQKRRTILRDCGSRAQDILSLCTRTI